MPRNLGEGISNTYQGFYDGVTTVGEFSLMRNRRMSFLTEPDINRFLNKKSLIYLYTKILS